MTTVSPSAHFCTMVCFVVSSVMHLAGVLSLLTAPPFIRNPKPTDASLTQHAGPDSASNHTQNCWHCTSTSIALSLSLPSDLGKMLTLLLRTKTRKREFGRGTAVASLARAARMPGAFFLCVRVYGLFRNLAWSKREILVHEKRK